MKRFLTGLLMLAGIGTTCFAQQDFNASLFRDPPLEYGPFTRWWWPGNDVEEQELKREVRRFAAMKFGGVEIQPFTVGINPESPRTAQVYSWHTPAYYRHLHAVMEEAQKTGLTVDMNGGSGWPLGGPFVKPEESVLTLESADTVVAAGTAVNIPLPALKTDYSAITRNGKAVYNPVDLSQARLLTVSAAKITAEDSARVWLDAGSLVQLRPFVQAGRLRWKAPPGGAWKIIALYVLPNGEKPMYIATPQTSLVADHLNAKAVEHSYTQLFGEGTGLARYYGKPFRAVFNDSKEFITSRHISSGFLAQFKEKRGYDISPWLAANVIPGYNNAYSFGRDTVPRYAFSGEDWRLHYDYNLTISDLYKENFLRASKHWMEKRGLQHRSQEYGLLVDIIGASGLASIPEAEQLSAGGSDGLVKLVASGGHLYNRPVIAQESYVFSQRAGMTTPQKIKAFANKSFAAGINQLVYHGSSYKYQTGEYGGEGWHPWSTPFRNFNYASNFNEGYNYWKYMSEINTFIARSQYALRTGKPRADVLVYFPFVDAGPSQFVYNPEETFLNGYFEELEPFGAGATRKRIPHPTVIQQWFIDFWPLANELEAAGLTWDYINDESLLAADYSAGSLTVRGNTYQALVLGNVPYIPLETAGRVEQLAKKGANVLIYGHAPAMQPGFHNYWQNDAKVAGLFRAMTGAKTVRHIGQLPALKTWCARMRIPVSFHEPYDFIRQAQREMKDGSRLHFFWNKSTAVKHITLHLDEKFRRSYCLDPETGSITQNAGRQVSISLQPYSAVMLYAAVADSIAAPPPALPQDEGTVVAAPREWNIAAGEWQLKNSRLFDWREDSVLKYSSTAASYSATFPFHPRKGAAYRLSLGNVYFTAEVWINGKPAGKRLWPPYNFDMTGLLQTGQNTIRVLVTPADRNFFVGQGLKGDPKYRQFQGLGKTLLPAGMTGPVTISELH
jgi:hypothetical protein